MNSNLNLKKGDVVKYSKPSKGEEMFRFTLLDDVSESIAHAKQCGMSARVDIELICGERIRPIETVEVSKICAA